MGFSSGRRTATNDQPVSTADRRTFLTVLDEAVTPVPGLACGIVYERDTPALNVISTAEPRRSVKIGADYADHDWSYTWAASGDTIGPVDDPEGVAHAIAAFLGAQNPP